MRLEEAIKKHGGRERLDYFERGWIEGVMLYSHMKDGVTYVGTTGTTLGEAVDRFLATRRENQAASTARGSVAWNEATGEGVDFGG
jgi:hypothetical protein